MNVRTFIDRPILAGVISVMVLLVGLIGLSQLPVEQFPEIADFHNQREKTLNAIRAKREEARKDKKNAAADARRNALRARLAA